MALGFVALTGSWPGRRSLAEASTGILMPPGESPDGVSADEEAVLLGGPGPEAEALMDGLTEYSSRLEGVMDTLGAAPDDFQDPEFQTSFLTDIPDPDVPGEEEPEFTPREAAVAVEDEVGEERAELGDAVTGRRRSARRRRRHRASSPTPRRRPLHRFPRHRNKPKHACH